MPHLALVDATDLTTWAGRLDSQSNLPLLIRRLVHATTRDITHVGFPVGDAVQLGGWDGAVNTPSGSTFVPAGISVWEMGTNQDIKGKADSDYEKRTTNPLDVDPGNATFVFVTPRRWSRKDAWVEARRREGIWRDVRAYDADSLEEWLGFAPSVHIWLSSHLGKFSEDAIDLDSSWQDWSECTTPVMTPQIVLAGRKASQDIIEAWLKDSGEHSIILRAESRDEAQAVFAATLMALPDEQRVGHLARTLVVTSRQAWHQLVANQASLILLPTFDAPEAIARALRNGHRVVQTLGRADPLPVDAVDIPAVASDVVRQELQESGMPESEARELASLARRSLTSFRRKIARSLAFQAPAWASPVEGPTLVPILLIGAWNAAMEGDRELLTVLARTSYSDLTQLLTRWAAVSDPPVRSVGDTWYLLSKEDAWYLLERYITREHLTALEEIVLSELGTVNAKFDLAPDDRWMATRSARTSGHLRESLAEALVILATRDISIGGTTGQDFVRACVWKLLQRANADWRVWASLPLVMLAEAAPDVFLNAVDEGLRGDDPVVMKLFETGGNPLFSTSPHTYLLWALEVLAWSPEHLGHVTYLLAKLTRLDPGGHTSNRPRESLMQIYLFWHAQTSASFEQRIQVLDRLRRSEPDVAWHLFTELLPGKDATGSHNPTPRWRDWAPRIRPTSYSRLEYYNGVCEVVRFLLEEVGTNGTRWRELISNLEDLPADQFERVVQALKALDISSLGERACADVWNALRSVISRHRSYPGAGWALAADKINDLETVYRQFEPQALPLRMAWLFDRRVELLEGRESDWKEHAHVVAEKRQAALCSMVETIGLQALIELVPLVASPWELGVSLGLTGVLDQADEDTLITTYLASSEAHLATFARGFVSGRVRHSEGSWRNEAVSRLWDCLTPAQQAYLLLQFPEDKETFDLAESSPETEEFFWSLCTPHFVGPGEAERVIRKLLQHGRPFTAIEQLDFLVEGEASLTERFIVEALQLLIRSEPKGDQSSGSFTYHLAQLLTRLESASDVAEDELASLEWALLPVLGSYERERPPRTLHRWLNRDPAFFVELVGHVYKPEGSEDREETPETVARARNGYHLLDSWETLPGINEAGDDVDVSYLMDWVHRAREGLTATQRLAVGDITLGNVLAHAPGGADGVWPHPAVREVIESVQSPDLDRGFRTGIFNSRGVYSKGLDEGGAQERELAVRYQGYADALRGGAPRTAAVLRYVAERYRGDALQEDQEAELREDLGW